MQKKQVIPKIKAGSQTAQAAAGLGNPASDALVKASFALNNSLQLDEVLRHILEQSLIILPHHSATVVLVEEEIACTARRSFETGENLLEIQEKKVSAQSLLQLKSISAAHQPAVLKIATEWPEWIEPGSLQSVRYYSVVPILLNGQDSGYLCSFRKDRRGFTSKLISCQQVLADHAAIAIRNARLYKDLENSLQQEQSLRDHLVNTEKLVAMGRMVASVAHELNNPLQTIKNCLFLTQQEIQPDSSLYEYLNLASSETQRLSNLVTQLLDLYRPQEALALETIEVTRLLEDVRLLLTPHLEHQNVKWVQSQESDEMLTVQGEMDPLKQVFLNISLNAIEAMQPEGGKLYVSVDHNCRSGHVCIRFQDTGPGIANENLPKIFEPFFTTKGYGIGLGLLISHEIIARHQGSIKVESPPGEGAVLTVSLPYQPGAPKKP